MFTSFFVCSDSFLKNFVLLEVQSKNVVIGATKPKLIRQSQNRYTLHLVTLAKPSLDDPQILQGINHWETPECIIVTLRHRVHIDQTKPSRNVLIHTCVCICTYQPKILRLCYNIVPKYPIKTLVLRPQTPLMSYLKCSVLPLTYSLSWLPTCYPFYIFATYASMSE